MLWLLNLGMLGDYPAIGLLSMASANSRSDTKQFSSGDTIQALPVASETDATLLSVSTSSANVALPGGPAVRVYCADLVRLKWGTSESVSVTTSTGFLYEAGTEVMAVPKDATHIAAIIASGTSTVELMPCEPE